MLEVKLFIKALAFMMAVFTIASRALDRKRLCRLALLVFIAYLGILLWLTLFSRAKQEEAVLRLTIRPVFVFDRDPTGQIIGIKQGQINVQSWQNIMLFVPMGFLLPMVLRSKSAWRTLGIGFLSSVAVELIQYVTRRGWCDLDDVVLNVSGTIIGYLCMRLLVRFHMGDNHDDG